VRRFSDRFAKAGTARTPPTAGLRAQRDEGSRRSASGNGSSGPETEVDRGVIRTAGPHDPVASFGRSVSPSTPALRSGCGQRTDRVGTRSGSDPRIRFREGVSPGRVSARFDDTLAERQRSFPGSPSFGMGAAGRKGLAADAMRGLRGSRRCRQRDLAFQGGAETLVRAGPSMLEGSFGQLLPVRGSFRRTGARDKAKAFGPAPRTWFEGRGRESRNLRVLALPDRSGAPRFGRQVRDRTLRQAPGRCFGIVAGLRRGNPGSETCLRVFGRRGSTSGDKAQPFAVDVSFGRHRAHWIDRSAVPCQGDRDADREGWKPAFA